MFGHCPYVLLWSNTVGQNISSPNKLLPNRVMYKCYHVIIRLHWLPIDAQMITQTIHFIKIPKIMFWLFSINDQQLTYSIITVPLSSQLLKAISLFCFSYPSGEGSPTYLISHLCVSLLKPPRSTPELSFTTQVPLSF